MFEGIKFGISFQYAIPFANKIVCELLPRRGAGTDHERPKRMMSQQIARGPSEVPRTFGFEVHDPQRFAQNMARLVEETGKAVTAFVEPRVSDPTNALVPDDLTRMMNTFRQVQQAWLVQPQKLCEGAIRFVAALLGFVVLRPHGRRARPRKIDPVMAPDPKTRASRTRRGRRTSISTS